MKGPKDELLETFAPTGVKAGEKPPGGKALQRLILFNEERGLLDGVPREPEKAARKRGKISKDVEAVAADEATIAQMYADTAQMLHGGAAQPTGIAAAAAAGDLAPPSLPGPQWRFLGPTMMSNGQTYGDSRVVVSGRIAAIAIDPANANHILCGSAGGGVWESRDRGTSWAPRTDYLPTLTVGALAFNPSAPNVVYCGTGEGNFYWRLGAGLLRSTDGGTTWAMHATAPFVGQGFYDLIVDRTNGNHLLAATTGGIYESNDGGTTWTLRRAGICWDLTMRPTGGTTAEILAACQDGVYRSANGGATWAKVALPAGAPAGFNRLAVDIAPSNPAVAYAFGASGGTAFLYRRNAAGVWQSVAPPAGLATGQAWYDWFLAVAPDTDAQIYLGAIEVHRGTLGGAAWSWVTISNKAGDDIHPDQHAIAFDPVDANVIYVGCDGGLYRSPNRGTAWQSLNNGLGITEIEYIAQDHGSARWLMAGTQDNGSIRYTGNPAWDHIADGDGGDCGVNRANPNTVFHSYYGMGLERSTVKGDFGSFSGIGPSVPAGYNSLFYPPMEVNNSTVAQAGQSVFVSRNNGGAWTQVALPAGEVATAMYIPNPNTVFVGTRNGRLFRITWTGAAWSAATELTRPRTAYLSDIFVDPANLNRIWVTYTTIGGGRVFRSDNGGAAWTDLSAGLPALPINAVEVDPANANRVWVAADVGVYQSFDAGATWSAFVNGLPNALAVDLLFHPHARVLRVAFRNRGVWEIPVDGWLIAPILGVQFTGTLAANQSRRWFTFNWPATWHVLWTVMPTTPQPGAPQITWQVQVERASAEYVTYWINATNLTSAPVTFEGRYAILSKY